MKNGNLPKRLGMFGTVFLAAGALACGPFYPSGLFHRGDSVVLAAPAADFQLQLELMDAAPTQFVARPPTNGYFGQTLAAELGDLRKALGGKFPRDAKEALLRDYETARRDLQRYIEEKERAFENHHQEPPGPVAGLPPEFAEYWRGLVAFRTGNIEDARAAWRGLLRRPASERPFRTVWATYMLGRAADTNWVEAIEYFRRTRADVAAGFSDSLGLAEASLGWEARAEFKNGGFVQALHLYLEQRSAGDPTARLSLAQISAELLRLNTGLDEVAADAPSQKVITAFVLARGTVGESDLELSRRWLRAVEAAGAADLAAGERLALAAYQAGDMDATKRWLQRSAPGTAVARWVQAKLFLREGKMDQAAALLAGLVASFPTTAPTNAPSRFSDTLMGEESRRAGSVARGELATLQLARREFVQALDTLLGVGTDYWRDAAYIAERVLTLDELKYYVDRHPSNHSVDLRSVLPPPNVVEADTRLRHLLARRLFRANRGGEARPYLPPQWHPTFDALAQALEASEKPSIDQASRADALWQAAQIVRTNGMEMLGTELEPDWFIVEGDFELGNSTVERGAAANPLTHASEEELRRSAADPADPNLRFHYRYLAADLAWQAAKLMPDNADKTALVLCRAGEWLKYTNPQAADRFYKALVRRCRKLPIGQEAEARRWFPTLDPDGNIIPRTHRTPEPDAGGEASAATLDPTPQ